VSDFEALFSICDTFPEFSSDTDMGRPKRNKKTIDC